MAKKRANGEGNIRKRKDGHWEGRYTTRYDSKTGKRLIGRTQGRGAQVGAVRVFAVLLD